MTITAAEVLAEVNERLNRSETAITDELRAILKDLSIRGNFLTAIDESQTLTSGTVSLDEPVDFKALVEAGHKGDRGIVLNDGIYDGKPLKEISYAEYLRRKKDETSANYDEPKYFAHWNNKFYLDPASDDNNGSDYTSKIHHYRFHPESTSSILFGDQFREAIYCGVTSKVEKKLKGSAANAQHELDYEREIAKLLSTEPKQPNFVKYRDI